MNRITWVNPSSLEAAISELENGSVVKAGAVDLMDLMKEHLIAPKRLVNLRTIEGLDGIEEQDDALHLGPLVTLAHLADSSIIRARYRALADAAGHAATPQIRNMATVGGNLLQRVHCWYFRSEQFNCKKKGGTVCFAQDGENAYHAIFDNRVCAAVHPSATAVALVALGATIRIVGPQGSREQLLEASFVSPKIDVTREHALGSREILARIVVPRPTANTSSAYLKQGEKESYDWPLAEVAVVIEREDGRCKRASIVLGAAAPVPYRAKKAEQLLRGKAIDDATARTAAKAALEGATPLANNSYKLPMFETIIRRTILAAARPS